MAEPDAAADILASVYELILNWLIVDDMPDDTGMCSSMNEVPQGTSDEVIIIS